MGREIRRVMRRDKESNSSMKDMINGLLKDVDIMNIFDGLLELSKKEFEMCVLDFELDILERDIKLELYDSRTEKLNYGDESSSIKSKDITRRDIKVPSAKFNEYIAKLCTTLDYNERLSQTINREFEKLRKYLNNTIIDYAKYNIENIVCAGDSISCMKLYILLVAYLKHVDKFVCATLPTKSPIIKFKQKENIELKDSIRIIISKIKQKKLKEKSSSVDALSMCATEKLINLIENNVIELNKIDLMFNLEYCKSMHESRLEVLNEYFNSKFKFRNFYNKKEADLKNMNNEVSSVAIDMLNIKGVFPMCKEQVDTLTTLTSLSRAVGVSYVNIIEDINIDCINAMDKNESNSLNLILINSIFKERCRLLNSFLEELQEEIEYSNKCEEYENKIIELNGKMREMASERKLDINNAVRERTKKLVKSNTILDSSNKKLRIELDKRNIEIVSIRKELNSDKELAIDREDSYTEMTIRDILLIQKKFKQEKLCIIGSEFIKEWKPFFEEYFKSVVFIDGSMSGENTRLLNTCNRLLYCKRNIRHAMEKFIDEAINLNIPFIVVENTNKELVMEELIRMR